ncbi:GGDEF domain-containing protein [Deinococcus reticulitermitis]|uniref:GGDEF domain-containing protein n=1 Tax=Deinococcus reticulitermitis TaxID=856736 RepID=UPI001FE03D30|nr:GGDEF domain-containing protein [Deinococcus reticulitermitis]
MTDPLTGLPNRRAFDLDVAQVLAGTSRARPRLLIMMDVHRFKTYNDIFGHATGDDVLRGLGRVLRRVLGGEGAYRLGGDEFALLPPTGTRPAHIAAHLEREVRAEAWPPGIGPVRLQAGAVLSTPGLSPHQWLRQADARLYRAKHARQGEDRWDVEFGRGDLGEPDAADEGAGDSGPP